MTKLLQTSLVEANLFCLIVQHKLPLVSRWLWIPIPCVEKNSMFEPKRHPSPTQKMTGTFQSCEREELGDQLAGDPVAQSGPAVRIFSHGAGAAASDPGPRHIC